MDKINKLIDLLGENEIAQLRKGIIDILLNALKEDLEDFREMNYTYDFDEMFGIMREEVEDEVKKLMKETYTKFYKEAFEKKLESFLNNENSL